ncbi:hypothetical protein D7X74_00875 [Corallococcus sp. CA047B]|uniref:hypothetical protein n=1 Tax=Corallococcus sp. CA047B TaxID=2316729 RepID=UPI000EA0EE52|nr:hypothetical protein [Corallococcus sp. CA047B]RKH21644.1 hypothetical protein D7X74_00875 [Corallococcus sp. CA047B]
MSPFKPPSAAVLTVLASLVGVPSAFAVTPEVRDFLIQDVCVDGADQPIAGDPYTCPSHRDLRQGEAVPYLRTDKSLVNGAVYQSVFSFPVRSPNAADPNPRVVVAKEFGGNDVGTAFRDFDRCTNGNCTPVFRDGYDVAEMNGTYVSFVGTSDPGINHQTFWRSGCPSGTQDPSWNEDGWILFPSNLTRGVQGNVTHGISITTNDRCLPSFNSAHAAWDYPAQDLVYTSGKSMPTITSHHFAGTGSNNATSFEVFFFTKQYGFTRWEAWKRSDQCGSSGCAPLVNPNCNGATSTVFSGQTFYRLDCRDSTYVIPQPFPLEPVLFLPTPQLSRTQNLVKGGTFANGLLEAGWNRFSPQTATNWTFKSGQHTANNVSLAFSCAGTCSSNSVYHDANVSSLNGGGVQTVRYGAALKADATAGLYMQAHLFALNGTHLTSRSRYLDAGTSFARFQDAFAWDFNAQPLSNIRLEFYPVVGNRDYHLDEVFLVGQ